MCKILAISGIKKKNVKATWTFIKAMKDPMSKHNRDGLGYAAITNQGNLFGERWFQNSDAFEESTQFKEVELGQLSELVTEKPSYTTVKGEYNSFGTLDKDNMVAITMHTRMATSAKVMMNTHPFVENNVALIHNGVIRNVYDFKLRQSTCDSETILMQYNDYQLNKDSSLMSKAMADLKGYYACGVLTKDAKGIPIMDVFKSESARLTMTYVNEIENWVFTTDDTDVSDACKSLGFTHGKTYTVKAKKLSRFNAITGKVIEIVDFEQANEWDNYTGNTYKHTVIDATKSNIVVYPHTKRKNTHVSKDLMEYYKAGKPTVTQLSEREVEEEILSIEASYGGWRT